ncbi:MAG: aquaporin [Cellulomonadaceae bacterium]|jgi:aquaporin Z|nr:aquaporin [Cellulomonadaceae bacterium]
MAFSDSDNVTIVEELDGDAGHHHGHGHRFGHHGHGHHGHGHGGSRYGEFARVLAEALGTFILTLAILASFVWAPMYGQTNWLIVALTVGLALTAAMAAVGHVSGGGDFNPAVTLGKAIAGRTAWRNVLPYIVGQLLGALLAAFVMWAIIPDSFAEALQTTRGALLGSSAPGYGTLSPLGQATAQGVGGASLTTFGLGVTLLVEIIFTAIFVAVVLGATRHAARRAGNAPLIVGLTFAMLYLMLWPISRGGLNPARAFGSVILSHDTALWRQLWVFIVGPLIGAALAGLFYRAFHPGLGHLPAAADLPELGDYYEGEYTAVDVADPVLATYEPAGTTYTAVDATAKAEQIRYAAGEAGELLVTDDVVVEDGDPIIFGRDAQTVADIEDDAATI